MFGSKRDIQNKKDNQTSIKLFCEERMKRDEAVATWSCKAAKRIGDASAKEACRKHTDLLIQSIFHCQQLKETIRKEEDPIEHYELDGRIRTPTIRTAGDRNI